MNKGNQVSGAIKLSYSRPPARERVRSLSRRRCRAIKYSPSMFSTGNLHGAGVRPNIITKSKGELARKPVLFVSAARRQGQKI